MQLKTILQAKKIGLEPFMTGCILRMCKKQPSLLRFIQRLPLCNGHTIGPLVIDLI